MLVLSPCPPRNTPQIDGRWRKFPIQIGKVQFGTRTKGSRKDQGVETEKQTISRSWKACCNWQNHKQGSPWTQESTNSSWWICSENQPKDACWRSEQKISSDNTWWGDCHGKQSIRNYTNPVTVRRYCAWGVKMGATTRIWILFCFPASLVSSTKDLSKKQRK